MQNFEIDNESWYLMVERVEVMQLLQDCAAFIRERSYDPVGGLIIHRCLEVCIDQSFAHLFDKHEIKIGKVSRDVSYTNNTWVAQKLNHSNQELERLYIYNNGFSRRIRSGGSGGIQRPDNVFEIILTKNKSEKIFFITVETDKDAKNYASGELYQVCRKLYQSVDFARQNPNSKDHICVNVRINLHHMPRNLSLQKSADETEVFKNFFNDLSLSVLKSTCEILQHFVYDCDNPNSEKYDLMYMINDFSTFNAEQYASLGVRCTDNDLILRDPPVIIYNDTFKATRDADDNGETKELSSEEEGDTDKTSENDESDKTSDDDDDTEKSIAKNGKNNISQIREGRLSVSNTAHRVFVKDVSKNKRQGTKRNQKNGLKKPGISIQLHNTFPAESWFSQKDDDADKTNWYREKLCRYLHCYQPSKLTQLKCNVVTDEAISCSIKRSNAALQSLRSDLWDNWKAKIQSRVTVLSKSKLRVAKLGFQRINTNKIRQNILDPKNYQGFAYTRDFWDLDKVEGQFQCNGLLQLERIDLDHKTNFRKKNTKKWSKDELEREEDLDVVSLKAKDENFEVNNFISLWSKRVKCDLPPRPQKCCSVCYFMSEMYPEDHEPQDCPYYVWIEANLETNFYRNLTKNLGVHVYDNMDLALIKLQNDYNLVKHETYLIPKIEEKDEDHKKTNAITATNAENPEIKALLFFNAQTEMMMAIFRCFYRVDQSIEKVDTNCRLKFAALKKKIYQPLKNSLELKWKAVDEANSNYDDLEADSVPNWAFYGIDDLEALRNFGSINKTKSPDVSHFINEIQEEFKNMLLANAIHVQGMIQNRVNTKNEYNCRVVRTPDTILYFTGVQYVCMWQNEEVLKWKSRDSMPSSVIMERTVQELKENPARFFQREFMPAFTAKSNSLQSKLMSSLKTTLPELNFSVFKIANSYKNESLLVFLRMIRVSDYETLRALATGSAYKEIQEEHNRILSTMPISTQYAVKNMYARIRTERVRLQTFDQSQGLNTIYTAKK